MRVITAAALLTLAACSGASSGTNAAPVATATVNATPSPTPAAPHRASSVKPPATAKAIVRALAAANPKDIRASVTYNARTDSNHLLGRPNEYTSKSTWIDLRTPSDDRDLHIDLGTVAAGGSVEYFPSDGLARQRAVYIHSFGTLGSEYDYVDRGVLLRVSTDLLPAQAKRYEREFAKIMHHPAIGPIA